MKKIFILLTVMLLCSNFSFSKDLFSENQVKEVFKGLKSYSQKTPYSKAILDMGLGKTQEDKIQKGYALRQFKTYEKITALVVVEKKDEGFVIIKAGFLDLNKIKDDKKKEIILNAAKSFKGKLIKENKKTFSKIDAVSGATRYHMRIYATLNLLAKKIIEEMEKNPDWKYKNL